MSNDRSNPTQREAAPGELSSGLLILLAVAVGVTVANLYYSQPLVGIIGRALGLPAEAAGLVMTLTQLGYGAGVLVAVPLSALLENKRLVHDDGITVGLPGLASSAPGRLFLCRLATGSAPPPCRSSFPSPRTWCPSAARPDRGTADERRCWGSCSPVRRQPADGPHLWHAVFVLPTR
jgi:hypothetical protein